MVNQILPAIFEGDDFPGYGKVSLSYSQLATIINTNKRDWIAALSGQKAVYLITDRNNGKLLSARLQGRARCFCSGGRIMWRTATAVIRN